MFTTTDANRADVLSSCGVADLLGCPFVQAPSSSRARRDRRFRRAFLSGIACVQQGPPGLTKVGVSVSCTEGPHTCSKSDISSSKGDAGAQFSRVVRFASFRMQHLDGNTFEFTTGSSPDTNEADHPRGMLSDSGGVVSQALASPLPDGSSRIRGHADTRHPWQGDHPRVAKHASGDSMAIDTDSSRVACGAILVGAGASASTPQEQLLPHAGTDKNILSDASCYSATEVMDAGFAADEDESRHCMDIVSAVNPLDAVFEIVSDMYFPMSSACVGKDEVDIQAVFACAVQMGISCEVVVEALRNWEDPGVMSINATRGEIATESIFKVRLLRAI